MHDLQQELSQMTKIIWKVEKTPESTAILYTKR